MAFTLQLVKRAREEKNYLIHVSNEKTNEFKFYKYNSNMLISIGNHDNNNIRYNCEYICGKELKKMI